MMQESCDDGRREDQNGNENVSATGLIPASSSSPPPPPPPPRGGEGEGANDFSNPDLLLGFFQAYDKLHHKASTLAFDYDALNRAQNNQSTLRNEIKWTKSSVYLNKQFIEEQKDRIELVGSHWFYGRTLFQPQLWFRGGCQGKKDRARIKLLRAIQDQPALETKTTQLEQQEVVANETTHQKEEAYKQSLEAHQQLQRMKEGLIQQYSTDTLRQLQQDETKLQLQIQRHQQQQTKLLETLQTQLESANRCSSNVEIKTNSAFNKLQTVDGLAKQFPTSASLPAVADNNRTTTSTEYVQTECIPCCAAEDGGMEIYKRSSGLVSVSTSTPVPIIAAQQHINPHQQQELQSPPPPTTIGYVDYKKFDAHGNVVLTNNPCPNGCGYVVTWHGTYCCAGCCESSSSSTSSNNNNSHHSSGNHNSRSHGQHQHCSKCDRIPLSSQQGSQELYDLLLQQRQQHQNQIDSTTQDAREDLQCALSELRNGYHLLQLAKENATNTLASMSTTSSAAAAAAAPPPPLFKSDITTVTPTIPQLDTDNNNNSNSNISNSNNHLKAIINYLRVQNHEFQSTLEEGEEVGLFQQKQWMINEMATLNQQLANICQRIGRERETIFNSLRPPEIGGVTTTPAGSSPSATATATATTTSPQDHQHQPQQQQHLHQQPQQHLVHPQYPSTIGTSTSHRSHHHHHPHHPGFFSSDPGPSNVDIQRPAIASSGRTTTTPSAAAAAATTSSFLESFEHISLLATATAITKADVDNNAVVATVASPPAGVGATAPSLLHPTAVMSAAAAAAPVTVSAVADTILQGSQSSWTSSNCGGCGGGGGGGGGVSLTSSNYSQTTAEVEKEQHDTLSALPPSFAAVAAATATTPAMSSFEVVSEEDSSSAYVVLTNDV